MLRHVYAKDAPCTNLHDHQHIDEPKCRRHHNEEVRSNDRFGMIAHKGHPPLSRCFRTLWTCGHIPTNRAGRNLNSDLQQELIGDPFLSPSRIVRCHLDNQLLEIDRNSGTTTRPRLPPPEPSESLSMPADQRIRLDDTEDSTPVEQSGKVDECEADRIGSPPRFLFPLDI